MKGKTDARFTFDRGTWSCDIRLKTYNKIGKSEKKKKKKKDNKLPEQLPHTHPAGYMQLSYFILLLPVVLIQ